MKIENNILSEVCNGDIVKGTIIIPNNITKIQDYAFYCCSKLTNIIIPNRVKHIGCFAFAHCINLTSIVISDSVKIIDDSSFRGCSRLTNVTIGNGVKSINIGVFESCENLTNIIIPNGVVSIGDLAFLDCKKITSIAIPNSVTNIGEDAFDNCNRLITKIKAYKAFKITQNGNFQCRDKIYEPGKLHYVKGKLVLCCNGIHYCTNLFETFSYYFGEIDKDIAIFEIEPGTKILKSDTSKCCTNSCRLVKRLYREDVIRILNEGGK